MHFKSVLDHLRSHSLVSLSDPRGLVQVAFAEMLHTSGGALKREHGVLAARVWRWMIPVLVVNFAASSVMAARVPVPKGGEWSTVP